MHFTKDCVIIPMLTGCYSPCNDVYRSGWHPGRYFIFDKSFSIVYNTLNKTAGKVSACHRPGNSYLVIKNSCQLTREDGYFLCLLTSVMTAHNMMIKVNKSEYVTIQTTPFHKTGSGWSTSSGCLGKCIILSKLNVSMLFISMCDIYFIL